MNTSRKLLGAVAGLTLFVASAATHADAILAYGDGVYLGYIDDNIPSSPATEVLNINGLIQLAAGAGAQDCPGASVEICDRTNSTLAGPFPTAVVTDGGKDNDLLGGPKISLADSYQYILGKYDGPAAGAWVWYSAAGFSGDITLPGFFTSDGRLGLSHVSWYNKTGGGGDDDEVPEPGTLALIGLALTGLALSRRRSRKQ